MSREEEIRERLEAATPERWRAWPDNQNYEVSNYGAVQSWLRRGTEKADPLNPRRLVPRRDTKRGYLSYSIKSSSGNFVSRTAHSMVLAVWVGERPHGMEIAHLNGDPEDNRVSNLQYVTHTENESHKTGHGTRAIGESVNGAKLAEWQVSEIRYLASKGIDHGRISRLFDIGHKLVSSVVSGRDWMHVEPRKDAADLAYLLAENERWQGAALEATAGESIADAKVAELRDRVDDLKAENARLRAQLDAVDGLAEKYERWARTAINRRTNPIGVSIATEAAAELLAALNQGGETNGQ